MSDVEMERAAVRAISDYHAAVAQTKDILGSGAMAFDSASQVYRAALKHCGIKTRNLRDEDVKQVFGIYRASHPHGGGQPTAIAMDSAAADDFAKRFPGAAAVGVL